MAALIPVIIPGMDATISANLEVACFLRKEGGWWVAYCPALELASEGKTKAEAMRMFKEALLLYVESCQEAGTLAQIFEEAVNTGRARLKPAGVREQVQVPVPISLLAARHEARRAA